MPGFRISCLGYPEPTGTEMEYWAQNLNWSQLRRLRLHNSSVPLAAHLAPQLTVLEEIELSSPNHDNTNVLSFFNIVLSTLTSISLPCLPMGDICTISAHAAKLHTPSIHHSPLTNQVYCCVEGADEDGGVVELAEGEGDILLTCTGQSLVGVCFLRLRHV